VCRSAQRRSQCTTTVPTRQGEILALHWEDVNLEKGWLDVRFTLTEDEDGRLVRTEPKTAKSRRRIFLCRLAIDALREQRRKGVGSGFVFTAEHGGAIWKRNFTQREFYPLLVQAGVRRVTFHELRHTANTLLLTEGVSPNVMAGVLGHESTRMTLDVYGHVIPSGQIAAVDKLNDLFPAPELDGQMMVKEAQRASDLPKRNARKPLGRKRFRLVETWGVEPQTSYMRSKRSTS
jgi:integrase